MIKRMLCYFLVTALLINNSILTVHAFEDYIAIQESNAMWQAILDAELVDDASSITTDNINDDVTPQLSNPYLNGIIADAAKQRDIETAAIP